ncbi:MAG TPA: hypothetical protein DCM05_03270 [Elusimicrobia bacterium]|nr:hypothetical protein [Elusimicrobiota bacterium]
MSTPWGSFSYQYDGMNRLIQLVSPSGTFAFEYDLLGQQTLLRYPNGIEAGYGYDAAGQSTAVYHALGSYVVAYATYAYDNAGNRLSKYDLSGAHLYVYDVLHRLTVAVNLGPDGPVGAVETFEHDKAGNRIADSSGTVFDYDYANRIQWDNFYTYEHDANGNRISATGKLTGQTTSYVYDSENRRVEAHLPDGAVWTYKYDAKGRRVEKSLTGDASKTLRYVYDNEDVLAILDGSNNLLALFTHGPGLGRPLAMRQGTTDYYYHADALGSVVALTNSSGSVVESYEYTAYGRPFVRDGMGTLRGMSVVGNPFMYGGTERDPETGQNHMGHREQDPDAGTFMQEDPIGFAGGDVNLFAFAAESPTNLIDPLGLSWKESRQMLWEWASGTGHRSRTFGSGSNQVFDLRFAPGVHRAREAFYSKNVGMQCGEYDPLTNYRAGFGLEGLWQAGSNSTRQFVGNYRIDIIPNPDNTLTFTLTNTTSMTSLLYGYGPSWNRDSFRFGGNMTQVYTWMEPMRR